MDREELQREWDLNDAEAKHHSTWAERALERAADASARTLGEVNEAIDDAEEHSHKASRARARMFALEKLAARNGWVPFPHPEPECGGV